MLMTLMMSVALAQAAEPELFAESQGWQIARHNGGCMMTREFGGTGNTIVTFMINPTEQSAPLTIMVGNSGWSLGEHDDEGYRIEFAGNDAVWQDLAAHTFNTEADGDGGPDGVISIDFAGDAITPMMTDLAGATGLHLLRQGATLEQVEFDGTSAAVQSLGECLRTLP
jgi:hypothetical protein